MLRVPPTDPEFSYQRGVVGAATILLHLLLAWSLLRVAANGGAGEGAGEALEGEGKGMVVEFIALPSPDSKSDPGPISSQQERDTSDQQDSITRPNSPFIQADPQIDRALSDVGEQIVVAPKSVAQSASAGATQGGKPADDLLANYHGALRATIRRKWKELTSRPFPSGCTVRLDLAVGGPVNATSASGCAIPQADRMQLEAAVLMAQPLPYAGYEAVFSNSLPLRL